MPNSSPDVPLSDPDDRHPQQPPSGFYPQPHQYVGDERRHPPGQASVMVNTGPASLGLTGVWATVTNVSAAAVIAFLVITMYQDISSEMRMARQQFREDMASQREADTKRTESMVAEIRALTTEYRALTSEIRASRLSMERTEQRIIASPMNSKPE